MMVKPHDEEMRERALSEWASSKHAVLEGYPISQWRRGIPWMLGWLHPTAPKNEPPYFRGKWQFAEETPDEDILAVSQAHGIIKVSRDYEMKWRRLEDTMGGSMENAAVWNYKSGKILVSDPDNSRILIYNPETDTIEHTLTEFPGVGSFGRVRGNWEGHQYWRKSETGRIWVADLDNHFVGLLSEDGSTLEESFGTYGTSGDGLNLNVPYWVDGWDTYATICDYGNSRGIKVDVTTDDIKWLYAYPRPTHFSLSTDERTSIASVHFRPFLFCGDGSTGIPWWISEYCLTPTRYGTWLGTHHGTVYEWDLRSAPQHQVPAIYPNWTSVSADTRLVILPCLGWTSVKIETLSTAADTLTIYSLKTRGGDSEVPIEAEPDADGNLQWQEYDSVGLTADTLENYPITAPAGVMAVQVTGTGTVDLRAHFKP